MTELLWMLAEMERRAGQQEGVTERDDRGRARFKKEQEALEKELDLK